ncbi:MAG: LacI family DNA-binding transcriptional regulator [Mucilaginibacter sp.]
MGKKLSIQDIASQLNVAKSTVSFVLNGKAKEKRISDELSEKILKFIQEKGFRPNQLARSLSTGKTKMICLMVEKISDYFFSQIAFLLEELAYKNGYKIIYCSTENDTTKTKELIGMMRDRHVDGFIITPSEGIESEIKELIHDRIPVILFDRYFPDVPTDYVVLDNYQGTFDAVVHLTKSAFTNIAFITLQSDQTQMSGRLSGFSDGMKAHGLNPVVLKMPFKNDTETSSAQISTFLKKNKEVEAIIFATNYLAISGIKALNELGLKFPDDISIIAFDDHDIFNIYNPTISAIAQPLEAMAQQLFKTLLDKLENKVDLSDLKQIVIPAELKLRGSTRAVLASGERTSQPRRKSVTY